MKSWGIKAMSRVNPDNPNRVVELFREGETLGGAFARTVPKGNDAALGKGRDVGMHLAIPYVTCSFPISGPLGGKNLQRVAMTMGIALGQGIGTRAAARNDLDIGLVGEKGIALRLESVVVGIAPAPDYHAMECHLEASLLMGLRGGRRPAYLTYSIVEYGQGCKIVAVKEHQKRRSHDRLRKTPDHAAGALREIILTLGDATLRDVYSCLLPAERQLVARPFANYGQCIV